MKWKSQKLQICWILQKPQNGNGRVQKDIVLFLWVSVLKGGRNWPQSQTANISKIYQKWKHSGNTLDNPVLWCFLHLLVKRLSFCNMYCHIISWQAECLSVFVLVQFQKPSSLGNTYSHNSSLMGAQRRRRQYYQPLTKLWLFFVLQIAATYITIQHVKILLCQIFSLSMPNATFSLITIHSTLDWNWQ